MSNTQHTSRPAWAAVVGRYLASHGNYEPWAFCAANGLNPHHFQAALAAKTPFTLEQLIAVADHCDLSLPDLARAADIERLQTMFNQPTHKRGYLL